MDIIKLVLMTEVLINAGENIIKREVVHQSEHTGGFDLMYMLRMVLYLLVLIKLIEISFLRRKKHNLKERVLRKFIFAHQEIFKQFNEEDKYNMEITLNNTVKNASITHHNTQSKQRKSKKRVSFFIEKNIYHQPRKQGSEDDEDTFLQINQKESLIKLQERESFQEKKIQDQFQERFSLQSVQEKMQLASSTQLSSKILQNPPQQGEQISDLPIDSQLSSRISEPHESHAKKQ